MQELADVPIEGPRGQVIVMLLAALHRLRGGRTKQEIVGFIQDNQWFDLLPEDQKPYQSSTGSEPRWCTVVAWARKDCVESGLMMDSARDCWESTVSGLNAFVEARTAFMSQENDVTKCFFWAPTFKRFMDPMWQPSDKDLCRPQWIYRDLLPDWRDSRRGNQFTRSVEKAMENPQSVQLLAEQLRVAVEAGDVVKIALAKQALDRFLRSG